MRRLDRAAAEVNPFLTVIAIGLVAVTLTAFAALAIKDVAAIVLTALLDIEVVLVDISA